MGTLKYIAGMWLALAAGEAACNYAMGELGYASKAEESRVVQPGENETECLVGRERGCLRHKGENLEMKIPE